MTRTCSECPAELSRQNRTGRCRPCALRHMNANAEFQRRRLENLAVAVSDEGYKARHQAGTKRGAAARVADPAKRAALQLLGRTYGAANIHHAMTPEARAKCGAKVQAAHLAWCPREHWPLNQILKRSGYRLVERKAMIAEEVARAARREAARLAATEAAMTPFERQMEAVRTGRARIIDKPDLRPVGPAYSLTGNATALCG